MDVDIRLLRYFDAVARLGNLTEAAKSLHLSQPALTKQIKKLEDRCRVRLFVRSKAGMVLTASGRALADRVPDLLTTWDAALRETRTAARHAERVLRVGFLASAANEATPGIIAAFNRVRPSWRVDMRQSSWAEPTAGLSDASVDAALLRLPIPDQPELRVRVLFTEQRCAVLPWSHPLADRKTLHIDDLSGEPFIAAPAATGAWRDHWLGNDDGGDRPRTIGAITEHPDEWLTAIAHGQGIALAPESARHFYSRPGIVYPAITGVSPSRVAIAWAPSNDDNPVVQDFVQCCLDHRP